MFNLLDIYVHCIEYICLAWWVYIYTMQSYMCKSVNLEQVKAYHCLAISNAFSKYSSLPSLIA